jgi:D-sedoheptulose 7-phosphate isomerase
MDGTGMGPEGRGEIRTRSELALGDDAVVDPLTVVDSLIVPSVTSANDADSDTSSHLGLTSVLVFSDALALVLGFFAAWALRVHVDPRPLGHGAIGVLESLDQYLPLVPVILLIFWMGRMYKAWPITSPRDDALKTVRAVSLVMLFLIVVDMVDSKPLFGANFIPVYSYLGSVIAVPAGRLVVRYLQMRLLRRNLGTPAAIGRGMLDGGPASANLGHSELVHPPASEAGAGHTTADTQAVTRAGTVHPPTGTDEADLGVVVPSPAAVADWAPPAAAQDVLEALHTLGAFAHTYADRIKAALDDLSTDRVEAVGELLFNAYQHNKQVFVVGNGGSAATASHMACDLGKNTIGPNCRRFRIQSLSDNMPLLSALGNDLGYARVFSEQLINLIRPGDVLIVISASGRSPNILNAMHYAQQRAGTVIGLLGFDGGPAAELADEAVVVPVRDYGVVEDVHMIITHMLTGYFQKRLASEYLSPV